MAGVPGQPRRKDGRFGYGQAQAWDPGGWVAVRIRIVADFIRLVKRRIVGERVKALDFEFYFYTVVVLTIQGRGCFTGLVQCIGSMHRHHVNNAVSQHAACFFCGSIGWWAYVFR